MRFLATKKKQNQALRESTRNNLKAVEKEENNNSNPPREEGHGVDVRVGEERPAGPAVHVGHRVVAVVLVLPPRHRKALRQVAEHQAQATA